MVSKNQPAQRHEIVIEHQGKTIRAEYYIENGYVTVEAMSKNGIVTESVTLIGSSAPEVTTRILLKELITSGRI